MSFQVCASGCNYVSFILNFLDCADNPASSDIRAIDIATHNVVNNMIKRQDVKPKWTNFDNSLSNSNSSLAELAPPSQWSQRQCVHSPTKSDVESVNYFHCSTPIFQVMNLFHCEKHKDSQATKRSQCKKWDLKVQRKNALQWFSWLALHQGKNLDFLKILEERNVKHVVKLRKYASSWYEITNRLMLVKPYKDMGEDEEEP